MFSSFNVSKATWKSNITWALSDINSLLVSIFASFKYLISSTKVLGLTTTPLPTTTVLLGLKIPEGINLNLNLLSLNEENSIVFEYVYSIQDFLDDSKNIEIVKKAANKYNDKTIIIVLRENFGSESNEVELIPNIRVNSKVFKKTFKKEDNIIVFVKNTYKPRLDIIFNSDLENLNITDEEFSSTIIKTIDDIKKEEEQQNFEQEEIIKNNLEKEEIEKNNNTLIDELNLFDDKNEKESDDLDSFINYIDDLDENGDKEENKDIYSKIFLEPNEFDINEDSKDVQENFKENTILDNNFSLSTDEFKLKSIFDFIWRMFILYNKENQLDNLIYSITSHMPIVSYAQGDFIRDLSYDVDSLFDMILKLDYKLKYNNQLFYLYLSNLYYVKHNKVFVNIEFVDNFMIWESEDSRSEFIEKITKFINDDQELISKIIYSHFIEYSSYIKSFIPRIRVSIQHKDIYNIIVRKNNFIHKFNIFKIIFNNLNYIYQKLNLDIDKLIMNNELLESLNSDFEINLVKSCNVFLDEIRNFILLDGSTEKNINLLYNELINIDVSYLIEELKNVNSSINDEDELNISDLIAKEQERNEEEYEDVQNPSFDKLEIENEELNNLYNSSSNNDSNKKDKLSTNDILNTINEVNKDNEKTIVNVESEKSHKYDEVLENKKYKNESLDENIFKSEDDDIKKKIDEYERMIRANIELIESERKK